MLPETWFVKPEYRRLDSNHSTSKMDNSDYPLLPLGFYLKRLPMVLTLLLLLAGGATSAVNNRYDDCPPSTRNFTTGGTFEASLTLLLSSLNSNTPATGFFNDTKGKTTDLVYGLALCRGDLILPSECKACMETAVRDLQQVCSGRRSATIWYDHCLVRYSDQYFFSIPRGYQQTLYNTQNASDPISFNEAVFSLVQRVSRSAVAAITSASTPGLYAVEEANLTTSSKLYAMAQCTRDLSSDDCDTCLKDEWRWYIGSYPAVGLRNFGGSCFIRYESAPFYNIQKKDTAAVPPPTSEITSKQKRSSIKTVIIILVPSLVATFVAIAVCCWRRNQRARDKRVLYGEYDDLQTEDLLPLNFDILKKATSDFSNANKLGQGGFGPVYKGLLENGQQIAVKRLARGSAQGFKELRNEVMFVAKLQHRNLVRLLGWCLEGEEMLLVYECLPNSSLDKILYEREKSQLLDWETRFKIIEGLGRGLLYLHEESRLTIVHRDLKASNILLDENMNPKISDFGLAKLLGGDNTYEATSQVAGTFGYMAPEYVMQGKFSTKSDVYSFGVIVLELVTGQRNSKFNVTGAVDLINHVLRHWKQGNMTQVLDPNLVGRCPIHEVSRCVHMALLCVQENPLQRPSMSSVLLMLSSQSTSLAVPGNIAWGTTITAKANGDISDVASSLSEDHSLIKRDAFFSASSSDTMTDLKPR